MNKDLLAYALDWTAMLVQALTPKQLSYIKEIILFGSVTRGTAGHESDVDIFVNAISETGLKSAVDIATKNFYSSERFTRYWRLLGVQNTIKPIVGRLGEWRDLRASIIADGIVLYEKYSALFQGKNCIIVYWTAIKSQTKRVMLNKKLYGWRIKRKRYEGLVERCDAVKLGSNTIAVPLESAKPILDAFVSLGVQKKTMYVSEMR